MEVTVSRLLCIAVLVLLAVLHSAIGERALLGPLFASDLPRGGLPLGRVRSWRGLRAAWHLLSVAWLALAALTLRGDETTRGIVAATLLTSGLLALVLSRGRYSAWALLTIGGCAGLLGPRADQVGPPAAALAAAVLAAIALLHVAWLLGARWGMRAAIPEVAGRPAFHPPRVWTAIVAAAFLAAGGLVLAAVGRGAPWSWLVLAGAGGFALRALGDFRWVGLSKRVHGTEFARWDDGLYTPLSILLAICFALVGARGLA
jgi:hypothetical protein